MEARERRRMLGNIGFIGQLFRHELIVPRILNWCIVHLLKNHSESPVSVLKHSRFVDLIENLKVLFKC